MVRVRLFSTFKSVTGTEWHDVELRDGATVTDLLQELEGKAGLSYVIGAREYQWRHGSTSFLVVVSGRNIEQARWRTERLSPGDEVWLQPPVAGG